MIKNITILGAGESGFGAAMLAHQKGHNVFVSDISEIRKDIKSIFVKNSIKFENKMIGNILLFLSSQFSFRRLRE